MKRKIPYAARAFECLTAQRLQIQVDELSPCGPGGEKTGGSVCWPHSPLASEFSDLFDRGGHAGASQDWTACETAPAIRCSSMRCKHPFKNRSRVPAGRSCAAASKMGASPAKPHSSELNFPVRRHSGAMLNDRGLPLVERSSQAFLEGELL